MKTAEPYSPRLITMVEGPMPWIFLAAFSVAKEATIQVIRIKIIVPFKIFSSRIFALNPTNITARVAAACASLSQMTSVVDREPDVVQVSLSLCSEHML